jgi:FKBP-type peptidyl-prolyl cis-trans isomerase
MNKAMLLIIIMGIAILGVFSYFIFGLNTKPIMNTSPASAQKLKIEDLKIGTGSAAKSGDTIVINYLGTLQDGTKFDSSYDRGQPFETQIGVGQVIKGWDEGVIGMKVGGKRKLTIPPALGYGDQAAGSIPPNSTLIFEVELVGIK